VVAVVEEVAANFGRFDIVVLASRRHWIYFARMLADSIAVAVEADLC